ncbi:MAG TPA: antitoxin [Thermoanaerobaculia bacterium]|nr:antitoxin [Thermoanaerobaculia bacterium]
MRTTLEIDDDVLQAARSVATAEGQNIGKALSDLARRGLAPRSQTKTRSGFPVFDVDPDAAPITIELVKDALDAE